MTRTCSKCNQPKPFEQFSKFGKTKTGEQKYRPECKEYAKNVKDTKTEDYNIKLERFLNTVGEKQCDKCNTVKSFTEFSLSRTKAPGYLNRCKACRNEEERQRGIKARKNPEDRDCNSCGIFKTAEFFTSQEKQCKECRKNQRETSRNNVENRDKLLEAEKAKTGTQTCVTCETTQDLNCFQIRSDSICVGRRNQCNTCKNSKGYGIKSAIKRKAEDPAGYLETGRTNMKKFRENNPHKQAEYKSKPNAILNSLKTYAFSNSILWQDADENIFRQLVLLPCYFCKSTQNLSIGRIDNSNGYTRDNVLPSCKYCNQMKSHFKNINQFVKKAKEISNKYTGQYEKADEPLHSKMTDSGNKILKGKPSFEQIKKFRNQKCYLCNNNSHGIDRKDPNLNYSFEKNLEPCCKECNYMKSDFTPFGSVICHIHKIAKTSNIEPKKFIADLNLDMSDYFQEKKVQKTPKVGIKVGNLIVYCFKDDKLVAKFDSKKLFLNAINISNISTKTLENGNFKGISLPKPYSYNAIEILNRDMSLSEFKIFNEAKIDEKENEIFMKKFK